jgi:hypothetical protein
LEHSTRIYSPHHQILARAKEGSKLHTERLLDRIEHEYSDAGKDILDTISDILEIPQDIQGFEPSEAHLTTAVGGFLALTEVCRWYLTNLSSSVPPVALVAPASPRNTFSGL